MCTKRCIAGRPPPACTGHLDEDLRGIVACTAALLTWPLARLAVPGLIGEAASDPSLNQRLLGRFAGRGWSGLDTYQAEATAPG